MEQRKLKRWMKRLEVMKASGLGATALIEAIARREFPQPIRPTASGRADRWDAQDEVIAYQEARTAARVQREEEIEQRVNGPRREG